MNRWNDRLRNRQLSLLYSHQQEKAQREIDGIIGCPVEAIYGDVLQKSIDQRELETRRKLYRQYLRSPPLLVPMHPPYFSFQGIL